MKPQKTELGSQPSSERIHVALWLNCLSLTLKHFPFGPSPDPLSPGRFPWLPRPFPSQTLILCSLTQYSILCTLVTQCPRYQSKELYTFGCHSQQSSLNRFLWASWSRVPDNMKQGNQLGVMKPKQSDRVQSSKTGICFK